MLKSLFRYVRDKAKAFVAWFKSEEDLGRDIVSAVYTATITLTITSSVAFMLTLAPEMLAVASVSSITMSTLAFGEMIMWVIDSEYRPQWYTNEGLRFGLALASDMTQAANARSEGRPYSIAKSSAARKVANDIFKESDNRRGPNDTDEDE